MMKTLSATAQCSLFTSKSSAEQKAMGSKINCSKLPTGGQKTTLRSAMKKISTRQSSIITAVSSIEAPSTNNNPASAASTTDRFNQKDWDDFVKAYTSQYCEHAMFLDENSVEGTIPAELQGSLLRNGPALYEIGGNKIPQPFDGDGMAALLAFPGNGQPPFVSNRFVRTADYVAEQEAGKMLFRGAFSVGNPSGDGFYNPFDLSIKKVANTGIVAWAGRILALYERDLPYQLAAPDLKTVGRTDCDGQIDGDYFAAHYRILTDEKDGSRRLIGFNSAESGTSNKVTVWEFNEAGKQLHKTTAEFPDAAFAFLHDFAVTEKHYIFLENPVRLNFGKLLTKYMFGKACIAECLQYDPKNKSTKIHVIPRPGATAPGAPAVATAPRVYTSPTPFFSFHHVNAFEAPDGKIVVDTVALVDGMDFSANLEIGAGYYADNVGRGTLTRLVVTPWDGKVEQHQLMDRACEFPCVAPAVAGKAHTHAYLVGARMDDKNQWGAPQVVSKVTLSPEMGVTADSSTAGAKAVQKVYNPGPGKWAQEPIFVPKPNPASEDDGWVLVLVFDSAVKSTELVILNAQEMTVTAKVKLPFFLPAGLHGSWNGDYMGPPVGEEYPAKVYDIRNGASKYE
jgi:all-trans-8'-apo-beta-carotenal 15,15'-oxygenase